MDIVRATEIIRALADGVDPLTGEILPRDSICNQVDVVRAFHCALTVLEHPARIKKAKAINAGKPWTEMEEDKLHKEFKAEMKISEIAKEHGRSCGAIESKLARLGLIENSYFVRSYERQAEKQN